MTDKDWKDWHVVKQEKDERERKLMRNPGESGDVGIWTKAVLICVASPFIVLYIAYKISYIIALPVLWVAIGTIFDPWKPLCKPLAKIVGIGGAVTVLVSFLFVMANPNLLFRFV